MQKFGEWLLRNPLNAIVTAFILAILPITGLASGLILGLISLRQGLQKSASVLIAVCLPAVILYLLGTQNGVFMLAIYLGIWLGAGLLRRTASWSITLQSIALSIAVIIVLINNLYGAEIQVWQKDWINIAQPITSDYLIGILAASMSMIIYGLLILSRWWQAVLFNPGKLRAELHAIRANKLFASLFVIMVIIVEFAKVAFLANLLLVLNLPLLIAGVSLLHYLIFTKKWSGAWLFLVYLSALLASTLIGVLAIIDSWLNFRVRWAPTS